MFLHWIAAGWRCSGAVSSAACCASDQGLQGNRNCSTTFPRTRGGMLEVQAATVLALEAKSRRRERMGLDVVKLTSAAVEAVGKERKPVRGRQHDVSLGRNAGSLQPRCGGSHEFWRSWCGAAVRVRQRLFDCMRWSSQVFEFLHLFQTFVSAQVLRKSCDVWCLKLNCDVPSVGCALMWYDSASVFYLFKRFVLLVPQPSEIVAPLPIEIRWDTNQPTSTFVPNKTFASD